MLAACHNIREIHVLSEHLQFTHTHNVCETVGEPVLNKMSNCLIVRELNIGVKN